jgi:hypothetical protein
MSTFTALTSALLNVANDKQPSTNDGFAATILPASTKMLNRLYPAEPEGHWRT